MWSEYFNSLISHRFFYSEEHLQAILRHDIRTQNLWWAGTETTRLAPDCLAGLTLAHEDLFAERMESLVNRATSSSTTTSSRPSYTNHPNSFHLPIPSLSDLVPFQTIIPNLTIARPPRADPFETPIPRVSYADVRSIMPLTVERADSSQVAPWLPSGRTNSSVPRVTSDPSASTSIRVAPKRALQRANTPTKAAIDARSALVRIPRPRALGAIDHCPTPLQPAIFDEFLKLYHLSPQFPHLVHFLSHGFPIGDSMPSSLLSSITQPNYVNSSSELDYVHRYFLDDVRLGRMVGPLPELEAQTHLQGHFRTSPIGLVPKAGKPGSFCVIRDLSHVGDAGWSVNGCINHD